MREFDEIKARLIRLGGSLTLSAPSVLWIAGVALVALSLLAVGWPRADPTRDLEPLFPSLPLTVSELEQIEAALGESQLTDYRIVDGALHVPHDKRGDYLAALRKADRLPRTFHTPMVSAFESSSFLESGTRRMEKIRHAREQEAELLLIRSVPGVREAYVRFDETWSSGLRATKLTTAMVGIATAPDHPLEPHEVELIQNMLLALKAGIKKEDITIADLTAGLYYRGEVDGVHAKLSTHNVRHWELQWSRRIATVLSFLPQAKVTVHVGPSEVGGEPVPAHVYVSLPLDHVVQYQGARQRAGQQLSFADAEQQLHDKVQAAVTPLLVGSAASPADRITVNVLEVDPQDAPKGFAWRPWMPVACVLILAGVASVLITRRTQATAGTPVDPEPQLRVYGAEDHDVPAPQPTEAQSLQSKLRAYVEEDPDAAAKSLADFIDRAS